MIPAEITAISVLTDADAESLLRTAVLEFVDTVRAVERSIAATRRGDSVPEEFDVARLGVITEEEWREHWPSDAVDDVGPQEPEDSGDAGAVGEVGEVGEDTAEPGEDAADDLDEDTAEVDDEAEADDEREDVGTADDEPGKESEGSGKGSKRGRGRG
jgi:XTP/dITP diphosphohydrolase